MSTRKDIRKELEKAQNNIDWAFHHLRRVEDRLPVGDYEGLRQAIAVIVKYLVVAQAGIKQLWREL